MRGTSGAARPPGLPRPARPPVQHTRRGVLAALTTLSAAASAAGATAACGPVAPPVTVAQASTQRRVVPYGVRMLTTASDAGWPAYESIRDDLNTSHDDIFLVPERADVGSDPAALGQRLRADLAAGTAADLVAFPGRAWQTHATQGAFHPLDELAARENWDAQWPATDGYEAQTRFRGKRYMAPVSSAPMVLFYLKEPFDRAGLPYPHPDWTYIEFQDLCRKLTRATSRRTVFGYQWNAGYLRNLVWWRMNSQLEWDRVADPTRARWNTAAVIEAVQFQLYDSQYKLQISPTARQLRDPAASAGIEAGGAAMKMDGAGLLPVIAGARASAGRGSYAGAHFDVQVLPRGRASRTPHVCDLDGLVITKMSRDKEAAWEVLKWVAAEPGQRRLADTADAGDQGDVGRLPNTPEAVRKLWLPRAAARHGIINGEAFARALELSATSLAGDLDEETLCRESGLSEALAAVRDGYATAKDALDRAQTRIQRVLDDYWAAQG